MCISPPSGDPTPEDPGARRQDGGLRTSLEIGGDARGAEGVAAYFDLEAHVGRSATDHSVDVDSVHRQAGENARPNERFFFVGGEAGNPDAPSPVWTRRMSRRRRHRPYAHRGQW
jgi:hypothetical protein